MADVHNSVIGGGVDGQSDREDCSFYRYAWKHPLEKNVMNILEGTCQKCDKNWKKQRLKTTVFDVTLRNPKYRTA